MAIVIGLRPAKKLLDPQGLVDPNPIQPFLAGARLAAKQEGPP
jgi:hypothetical protein